MYGKSIDEPVLQHSRGGRPATFAADADRHYAAIRATLERKGTIIGANAMLIAAHAINATCVTDNLAHDAAPSPTDVWGGYFQDPDQHLWEVAWNPQLLPAD